VDKTLVTIFPFEEAIISYHKIQDGLLVYSIQFNITQGT